MGDREGVAVWVIEIGDLSVAVERGDALPVCDDRPLVVALEDNALRGELIYDALDVIDVLASQGRRRLTCVLRRGIDVHHGPLPAPIGPVGGWFVILSWRQAELPFVKLRGPVHIGDR
jgi:hypothetical protein